MTKSMVTIKRHYPEKDKGIVYPASNSSGCHIDGGVWHLNIGVRWQKCHLKYRLITVKP